MKSNQTKQYFFARVIADTNHYLVELGDNEFKYGNPVIIRTEFGEDLAYISSFPFDTIPTEKHFDCGRMLRYATDEDVELQKQKMGQSRQVRLKIQEITQALDLQMNITHVLLPLMGKGLAIFYTATERVDFRELLKKLRAEFSQKITLRQISERERQESFGPI